PTTAICLLLFHCSPPHPALHSFPTRRSSDLAVRPRRHRVDRDAVARPGRAALPVLRTLRRMSAPTPRLSRATRLQGEAGARLPRDRKSTRLNSSHVSISYAVFCLKKKNKNNM